MRFDVISLFPAMVLDASGYGVTGKAIEKSIVGLSVWNPRDYTHDRHKTVDDRPYGGGPGMVMKFQPLLDAVSGAKHMVDSGVLTGSVSKSARQVDFSIFIAGS
jgi:tRNA (guanine37-N1)-methyltransferase